MYNLLFKNLTLKISIVLFFLLSINISCKSNKKSDEIYVASWNLENLFDTVDDPNKFDEEFTPNGSGNWTKERLEKKLNNLARVISSMDDGDGPDLLGTCEVEHENLLQRLITKTKLKKNYKIAYAESPDGRGIDNGLIFNSNKFSLMDVKPHAIADSSFKTRFILQVDLIVKSNNDSLSVFINHWPSRRSGEIKSEPRRIEAALTLKKFVDDDLKNHSNTRIIILGDFNDMPTDSSILYYLNAQPLICTSPDESVNQSKKVLFNLAYNDYKNGIGTYKYHDQWNMLDQIIISSNLLEKGNFKYICGTFKVYKPEFMVEKSGKYKGTAFPTYGGRRYLGGYSDHFPVVSIFEINDNK